jgi:hypothetical protein
MRSYGMFCGGCKRPLFINSCPSETAFPEFDLCGVMWMCSVCGHRSYYGKSCLISFVIKQWFKGEDAPRTLYEYGRFVTYEDAMKCAELTENPACFPTASYPNLACAIPAPTSHG